MQRADAKLLMRYGMGLIMALMLGDVLSPSELRASCGDHVRYSTPGSKDGQSVDLPSRSLPAPGPCTGPGCERREAPPLVPVEPTTTTDNDTWGCLVVPLPVAPGDSGSLVASSDVPDLLTITSSIYHPPRS
jgi:hypothetical protein